MARMFKGRRMNHQPTIYEMAAEIRQQIDELPRPLTGDHQLIVVYGTWLCNLIDESVYRDIGPDIKRMLKYSRRAQGNA